MATTRKDHNYLEEVTTTVTSAGLSLLMAQIGGAPGAVVGAGIGGLAGMLVSRNASLLVDLFHGKDKDLVRDKVDADFDDSFLSDTHRAVWALEQAKGFVKLAQKVDVPKLDRRFEPLVDVRIASGLLDDQSVRDCLRALRKNRKPIRISCTAVCAAAVGVLKRMQQEYGNEKKYGDDALRLEIDFEPSNGRDQVTKLVKGDVFDFAIVPNDPFLFAQYKKTLPYKLLLACHGADQVLFMRKGPKYLRSRTIPLHVLVESSAELHFRYHGVMRAMEMIPVGDAEEIPNLIQNMGGGEGILAWNPLSSSLKNNPDYEEIPNTWHRIYYSLRCQDRWATPRATRQREAFQTLFVDRWRFCNRNRRLLYSLLYRDREFLLRFKKGAGLS